MDANISGIALKLMADVAYLVFECENEPPNAFFSGLARHSAFFALFEAKGEALVPKEADPKYTFSQNMPSLLNYQGKTNEFFTRLIVNLALSACKNSGQKIPAGSSCRPRARTLYDALMLGIDAYGIELYPKYFTESATYAAKFMQSEKFKHNEQKRQNIGRAIAKNRRRVYA